VILLDVELPGQDGFGVLERLKADPEVGHVPVVVITRRTGTDDVVRGFERGAHDYVRKPVEEAELVARVHAAARTRGLTERLRMANASLRALASRDRLTGLFNRRLLIEELGRLVARSERHGHPLSVVLLDVDGFHALNERDGHERGDAALAAIAAALGEAIREEDLIGRWGDDEFLVLAADTAAPAALELADAVRAAGGRAVEATTLTAGVASWQPGEPADALVRRAEHALEAAREAGGDGVRASPSGGT
jgi:two-component system cell cycle response regulator